MKDFDTERLIGSFDTSYRFTVSHFHRIFTACFSDTVQCLYPESPLNIGQSKSRWSILASKADDAVNTLTADVAAAADED